MSETTDLSLVVPIFNEADTIPTFFTRVIPILEGITNRFEIICINDGSSDSSQELLNQHHSSDPRIRILNLSRNFGKEAALTAGLDCTVGNCVIPIDADLQHPPELIPQLMDKWREGYDMVLAVCEDRRADSILKRLSTTIFYRTADRIMETPIPANAGDFRLMDRCVIEALRKLPERTRFMKGIFGWLGFNQATITFTSDPRTAGASKWSYWKLWNFALDGILSFSTLPLRIWTYIGILVSTSAFIYGTVEIIRTMIFGIQVPGYASLLVLILFFSGLNMIGLGILGEYLGRIFQEVKRRPIYLIKDRIGFD